MAADEHEAAAIARLEAALAASQARERFLRAILDRTEDSVTVKDLDGRYLYVNPVTAELVGLPLDACVGQLDRDFFPPEAYARIRATDEETARTGRALSYEITIDSPFWGHRTHHTHKFPFLGPTGEVAGVAAIIRDVTARKRMDLELAESEARFRGLIAASFEGICIHVDGVIVEANQALADMFGYAPEEMIGLNGIETAAPECRAGIVARIRAGDDRPYEVEAIRKDGTRFAVEMVGKPVTHQGRPARVSAFRDISARKALEQELKAQNDRLREVDRLKGLFVGAVSHELRTPLTTVRGYAEFLEEAAGDRLTPDQRHYLRQVLAGTSRLERLVDDLIDVARLDAGEFTLAPAETDLAAIVTRAVAALGPQAAARGVALVAETPGPLPLVADAGRLDQVLQNLIANALKFTEPGGAVTVTAAAGAEGTVRLAVRDTGRGIDAADLPHVFQRFYRTRTGPGRRASGLGLGLAISRALVEAHGGTIAAVSAPGQGATFMVVLPR